MASFDEDGMPPSVTTRAAAAVASRARRFPVSARLLQDAVDFLERTVVDETLKPGTRLDAVESIIKMEALNQVDEIKLGELADKTQQTEKVVLLLPPNGSEKPVE
jgi:hypothetical protein